MRKKQSISRNRWFYFIELIIDIAIIYFSYFAGFYFQRTDIFLNGDMSQLYATLTYMSAISAIIFIAFKVHTCGQNSYSLTMFYLLLSLPIIAFLSVMVDFLIKGIGVWRRTIFYAVLIQVPVFSIVKFVVYKAHLRFIKPKKCILVGYTIKEAVNLLLKLYDVKKGLYKMKYLVGEESPLLYEHINESEQVIICSSCTKKTDIMEYCAINKIDCTVVPEFSEILINSGKFNNMNDVMLLDMKVKMDAETRIVKRTVDIIVSAISLLVLLPFILIVCAAIKISDGGKILFRQERVTRDNKVFTLYKFRTMIENAEKDTGAVLSGLNDKRVTKLGKFLRATRIDEIPQLLNVLKGEMSLVGPRPERPELIRATVGEIPEFAYRTLVKAGLTGLAQTLGRYDTEFKDKVRFDLFYVNNFSLILDLKIIFYTIHTIFTPSVTAGVDLEKEKSDALSLLKEKGLRFKTEDECLTLD
jgi:exopolysaccharide biosynthesis polyprenyl glycosylphosphotransferase